MLVLGDQITILASRNSPTRLTGEAGARCLNDLKRTGDLTGDPEGGWSALAASRR
jgi:hypothetical protein